ncbi:reverse transcriptase domain-containing protein, partial [Streptococcus dysgalactiae]|uniref:reverse transcriptase domain-containing protein n=1 Tax=Streptococcus dysgalactiae TaxID=1334 RepID=UPI0019524D6E
MAYAKHSLSPKPYRHPTTDKIQDSIWLSVPLHQVELLVGCLYRPPNNRTDDFRPIIDAFNYIADLPCCSKIIAGDFNASQISWNSCTAPPKFLDFVSCTRVGQWTQQVTSPTRGNNCLDLIFTLGLSDVETKFVDHFPGSDHKVVTCNFTSLRKQTGENTCHRPFHLINWTLFADIIRKLNWEKFFSTSDPQLATDVLYTNLHHTLNLLTPPSIKSKRHGRNFGLTKMKQCLLKLQSSFSRTRDFSLILRMDRLSQAILRDTERQLGEQELKALAQPNRSVHLSSLLKCRNPPPASSISYIILPGNVRISSPEAMSDEFNKCFSASLTSDRNIVDINLPPHTIDCLKKIYVSSPQFISKAFTVHPLASFTNVVDNPSPCLNLRTNDTLDSVVFDLNDIQKQLSSIRPNFHPGPDGVPPVVFKLGGPDMGTLLLNLFNLSMNYSIFPSQWKLSVIMPLHKKGPLHDPSCYRPINHTPIVSRLMERIVKGQIVTFLLSRNLINDGQHGFLKTRSCVTCQLDFLNLITTVADSGKAFNTIFLDMIKAFNRVPHSLLIAKIRMFGIVDLLLSWLA